MAKTRRAYTGAAVSTTTSSNIAASGTTSFTVTAATGWPYGSDPFFVVVSPGTASEEKILVTRAGSGDTTINIASDSQRGQDGTVAVSHSSGSTVFPVFTALDADEANELAAKWSAKGDLVSHGASSFERLAVGTNDYVLTAASGESSGLKWGQVATAGIADGAVTGAKLAQGYTYVQTVYFTSSGTFTKATYPWLRAVRVRLVGGGGGGSGTSAGEGSGEGGGGGGGYAERFVLVSSLAASETVTVGAGGTGSADGSTGAGNGGNSSFGSHAQGDGATGAGVNGIPGEGGSGTGDVVFQGSAGQSGTGTITSAANPVPGGNGGSSHLGGGGRGGRGGVDSGSYGPGGTGRNYGGGGGGAQNVTTSSTDRAGGNGAAGIVIVDLYA